MSLPEPPSLLPVFSTDAPSQIQRDRLDLLNVPPDNLFRIHCPILFFKFFKKFLPLLSVPLSLNPNQINFLLKYPIEINFFDFLKTKFKFLVIL
jgi:hypothetical protein